MANKTFNITGIISNRDQQALSNLRIEAWDKDLLVDDYLGEATTDANGAFSIQFTLERYKELFLDKEPDLYFKIYSGKELIRSTENTILWNIKDDQKDLKIILDTKKYSDSGTTEPNPDPEIGGGNNSIEVTGQIASVKGVPLSDYSVEAFVKTIDKEISVAQTTTDAKGQYALGFEANNALVDVLIKTSPIGDENNVVVSKVAYNVQGKVKIDVVVPVEQVAAIPEYNRVAKMIEAHLGQLDLKALKEDQENNHITYLSNKTGLDARVVAMYAAAHQIGASLDIFPSHAYAMFRSGVPGKAAAIQSLSKDAILNVIDKAVEKNIISNDKNAQATLEVLSSKSADFVLNNKPLNAVSSMSEMLDLRLNSQEKESFAATLSQIGANQEQLWTNLAQNGFSQEIIEQLQLDGKMGFLTGQNASLIGKMYERFQISKEADLVTQKLHKADTWKTILSDEVPEALTMDQYAEHLANQVKISYPNELAASMIQEQEINLGANTPIDELSQFFISNATSNIIGMQPVKSWNGFDSLSIEGKAAAKSYERMYQLSPSDESMAVLAEKNISSGYQLAGFTKSEFMMLHGDSFPSVEEAEKVYNKGQEVYSAALNIATGYITQRSAPNVYAITGDLVKSHSHLALKSEETATIAYPTLEDLFGNMDYCSCDHCKSVLSPAAYFVELLQFIDLKEGTYTGQNPMDALTDRRPDIENIQLSCENTNMALPYIDLVNEILEYYILNDSLEDLQGNDVSEDTTQAELLAEPQYVHEAVYENQLKDEVFPYNLPFHQPLETLRRIFQLWGVSLSGCLSAFSTPLAARKEVLGISEEEYQTLTNLEYKNLPLYFGEPEDTTIDQLNAAIANGKEFSRRVGIKYEQLVDLLQTDFLNPGHELSVLIQDLTIPLVDLQAYFDGTMSDAELDALIPETIDEADYDNDVKAWLNANQDTIMGLITLTAVEDSDDPCDFAVMELRYALPNAEENSLTAIAYHKFHRFLRLMTKTGWSIETLDAVIKPLLPIEASLITEDNIDATFVTLLDRMANFLQLASRLSYSKKKYGELLLLLDANQTLALRQQQLANILKINLAEVLELSVLTGIDPFADDMEADTPSMIKFVQAIQLLKANGLKTDDLSYLLRHQDSTGKLTPTTETLLTHIKLLKDAISKVETENSIALDNADFALAQSKMLLVYDEATTDIFFGLLLGTTTYQASFLTSEEDLPEPLRVIDAKLDFDAFSKELTYSGVLTAAAKTAIQNAVAALVLADLGAGAVAADLTTFQTDFNAALDVLDTESNTDLNDFGTAFPELKTIYDAVIVEPDPALQAQQIVSLILPELKETLKVKAIEQVLISIFKADAEMIKVLSSESSVLNSAADATKSIRYDFEQLEREIAFDQNQTYTFYLDVPATDEYIFYLNAPENAVVSLSANGDTIINNVVIDASNETSNAVPISLSAGSLHTFVLDLAALPAGESLSLFLQTKGMGKTEIPSEVLYNQEQVNFAMTSLIRLEKATQISQIFKLNSLELEYFATLDADTSNFLNELPVTFGISDVELNALWAKIELLAFFQSIKKENEPEENTWLSVLINPDLKNSQDDFLLESFNSWQEDDFVEVLNVFGLNRSDLSRLPNLRKVKEAMTLIKAVGYPAAESLTWMTNDPSYELVSGIKEVIKDNVTESVWLESLQSVNDVVRNKLRDALVSYIIQYKRPSSEIDNPDKLYEYFLIDVEMDACMKTSRIRQALSTVQLFIQRCLMSLEPTVDASSIRADHWTWMQRYRVWEANRKVFLYPENWLEPELRDNKSTFFSELEGAMMQQEITDESAELAFLNYLKKLDDIAKLEVIGTYLEENEEGNQDDNILHVIGRSNGNTRQHYYRRFEYGYWTPWEKISLNIEGEHVFPIIWKKRLFVFWLSLVEKPADVDAEATPTSISTQPISTNTKTNVEVNICWGEYYKGKWTSPKSTELEKPLIISKINKFNREDLLLVGRKERTEKPAGKFRERLIFNVIYEDVWEKSEMTIDGGFKGSQKTGKLLYSGKGGKFTFTSKNAPPNIEAGDYDSTLIEKLVYPNETLFTKGNDDASKYKNQVENSGRTLSLKVTQPDDGDTVKKTIFTKKSQLTTGFNLMPTQSPVENQFEAPLFYSDERSTLFAQPRETITYIRDVDIYYPVPEPPIIIDEPPIIIDEPIPNWPPIDIYGPDIEDIVTNPWVVDNPAINPNIDVILPTEMAFQFGDVVFGMQGAMEQEFTQPQQQFFNQ